MKKLIALAGGATIAASASLMLFGSGLAAAAPDVEGQTYADAAEIIESAGGSPTVVNVVGSQLPQSECIVTEAWDAALVRDVGGEFGPDENEINVSLNCNSTHASATDAGPSLQSEVGREAKEAADAEEEALAEVSAPGA